MEQTNTMGKLTIIHRINTIEELKNIPKEYGIEIDVRGYGNKLLLNHDPIDPDKQYDELEEYLSNFNHAFIIFNIKEAGYEDKIIGLARKHNIENYFLFLFSGLLPWQFFSLSLAKATPSFINERNLLQKANFPRSVIPISIILANFFHLIVSLTLLVIALIIIGHINFPFEGRNR